MLFRHFDVIVSPYEEFVQEANEQFPWILVVVAILLLLSIFPIVKKIKSKKAKAPVAENECPESTETADE